MEVPDDRRPAGATGAARAAPARRQRRPTAAGGRPVARRRPRRLGRPGGGPARRGRRRAHHRAARRHHPGARPRRPRRRGDRAQPGDRGRHGRGPHGDRGRAGGDHDRRPHRLHGAGRGRSGADACRGAGQPRPGRRLHQGCGHRRRADQRTGPSGRRLHPAGAGRAGRRGAPPGPAGGSPRDRRGRRRHRPARRRRLGRARHVPGPDLHRAVPGDRRPLQRHLLGARGHHRRAERAGLDQGPGAARRRGAGGLLPGRGEGGRAGGRRHRRRDAREPPRPGLPRGGRHGRGRPRRARRRSRRHRRGRRPARRPRPRHPPPRSDRRRARRPRRRRPRRQRPHPPRRRLQVRPPGEVGPRSAGRRAGDAGRAFGRLGPRPRRRFSTGWRSLYRSPLRLVTLKRGGLRAVAMSSGTSGARRQREMSVLELPEELVALRDAIRSFIQREVAPKEAAYAQEIQETGTFSELEQEKRALRKRSATEGFYTLFMPESAGGGGVGYLGLVLCVEECLRHGLLMTMPGSVLPSVEGPTPILLNGTPEQQERYLQPTMRAEREACFALTEPDAGSDATRIRTRAERVDGGWVINGRKHFITHGAEADYVILFAVTEPGLGAKGGISCFLVDKDTPGFEVGRRQRTMYDSNQAELVFTDCRVDHSALLGQEGYGFYSAMRWINGGRMSISGMAIGTAQYLYGRLLVYAQADALDHGADGRKEAALSKYVATEMVGRIADRAIQVFGGNGYMTEMGIERYARFVRAMRLYEGTSEILKVNIARSIGLG